MAQTCPISPSQITADGHLNPTCCRYGRGIRRGVRWRHVWCVSPTTALRKSIAQRNRSRRDPGSVRVGGKTSVRGDVGQLWRVHVGMSSPWPRRHRYLRFQCLGSYHLRLGAHESVHGAHRVFFLTGDGTIWD